MYQNLRRIPLALLLALPLVGAAWASGVVPATLEARREELKALTLEIKDSKASVGPLVNNAIPAIPEFVTHLSALHKIPLTNEERQALLDQGAAGLSPAKAAKFRAAAPAFAEMKSALEIYFAAYDKYQRAEIRMRAYGAVLGALERRAALEENLSDKARAKFDAQFAKMHAAESNYRTMAANPASKHYKLHQASKDLYFGADGLDDLLLKYERKAGLAPKQPWGHKVGKFFKGLKQKARFLKIQAAGLPAIARLATHMFLRPFWNKKDDPMKTNDLIRFYSKSYRWAAGMKLKINGQDGIPKDAPVVFALSHRATIEDAMTMTAALPGKYSFMWAARAMPKWLTNRLVKDPTVIAVGGKKEDGTKVDAIEESIEAIKKGNNLALFPEGNVPSPQKETRPLRGGIDVITQELGAEPIYIVPVTIDDNAPGWGEHKRPSERKKLSINVTVGSAIDPLRLRSVPGADRQLLLNVIRGIYHRNLYRPDVSLSPPECEVVCNVEDLGVIPAGEQSRFEQLHAR